VSDAARVTVAVMYEQEVKLTAADATVLARVLGSELVRQLDSGAGRVDGAHYLGIYYDTAARALEGARCSLRARLEGDAWRAALKYRGTIVNGLSTRRELEVDIAGELTCADDLPDGEFKRAVLEVIAPRAPLHEYLRVDMHRSIRNLLLDGTVIELSADNARIINRASGRQTALYEIELELKRGDIEHVVELGEKLKQLFPLTPSTLTKRRIGLNLDP